MLYEIAITLIDGIGPINAKNLISFCGSAEAVFKEKAANLQRIPGIGAVLAKIVGDADTLERAEKELSFIEKNDVRALLYTDKDYPNKLKHCDDCPLVLYTAGNASFKAEKVVSIVGTRSATTYGLDMCREIVAGLAPFQPVIASGLALGIDSMAHKAALENNLQTWAAVGHGLDTIYPASNRSMANNIRKNGAIISEFVSGTPPDKENFPMRNRIVAGLADVTIVVETPEKGGSMITAGLAVDYSRDVFAVPGRITDPTFSGCHRLVAANKAFIYTNIDDFATEMGWLHGPGQPAAIQPALFVDLSTTEQTIIDHLREKQEVSFDHLSMALKIPMSRLNSELLSLELKGLVKILPGKRITL